MKRLEIETFKNDNKNRPFGQKKDKKTDVLKKKHSYPIKRKWMLRLEAFPAFFFSNV